MLSFPHSPARSSEFDPQGPDTSRFAFLHPQRGGVVIMNPTTVSPTSFGRSFKLFEQQLRKLLGVPTPPHSSPGRSGQLQTWQVDALVRKRLLEAATETVDTLAAITQLVNSTPNMVVSRSVQFRVEQSLEHLALAKEVLAQADPHGALSHAAQAMGFASRAYYDPSMLAMLYFPNEHKYAIYLPLFGPISVPLVSALVKEIKAWRDKRRAKGKDGAAKDNTLKQD